MKWLIKDLLKGDMDKAIEIDLDVITAMCEMNGRESYEYLMEKYEENEQTYALIRWGFLLGIKMAVNDTKTYRDLLLIFNALTKLGSEEAIKRFLKAELEDDYNLVNEIFNMPI